MKLANLFRYTEVIQNLTISVSPTGKDDQVNIQGAMDILSGVTPEKPVDPKAVGLGLMSTHLRRRWKWPWERRNR